MPTCLDVHVVSTFLSITGGYSTEYRLIISVFFSFLFQYDYRWFPFPMSILVLLCAM